MSDLATLTRAEQIALDDCERVIGEGIKSFVATGSALTFVRDNRLYRTDYATFEAYCRERWNLTPQHANRLALAAGVIASMEPLGSIPPPTSERQARELAKVPEPERAEVWRETIERTEGKPTAAAVRETVERTQTPPSDPGIDEPTPEPYDPPPGSPATWTPEQVEANQREVERKRMIESARRHARTIATTIRAEVLTVTAGAELGEQGLITAEMVADIRDSVDFLAKFVEVPS